MEEKRKAIIKNLTIMGICYLVLEILLVLFCNFVINDEHATWFIMGTYVIAMSVSLIYCSIVIKREKTEEKENNK